MIVIIFVAIVYTITYSAHVQSWMQVRFSLIKKKKKLIMNLVLQNIYYLPNINNLLFLVRRFNVKTITWY